MTDPAANRSDLAGWLRRIADRLIDHGDYGHDFSDVADATAIRIADATTIRQAADMLARELRALPGTFTQEYIEKLLRELESRGWQTDSRGDPGCADEASAAAADLIRHFLREPPGETRGDWQPIETAPKDGTRVLLWLSDEGFAVTAAWRVPPAYPDEDPCWWSMEMDLDVDQFHEPTHWMPVPRLAPTTAGCCEAPTTHCDECTSADPEKCQHDDYMTLCLCSCHGPYHQPRRKDRL